MKWSELYIKEIEDPHVKAVLNLMYTGVRYSKRMEQLLKPFGVSHQQFEILKILSDNSVPFFSLREIQLRLINQTSNTTRLVEKLKLKGFIHTQVSENNRSRLDISISSKGTELLKEIEVPLLALSKQLKATFSEIDADELSRILPKIQDMLDE